MDLWNNRKNHPFLKPSGPGLKNPCFSGTYHVGPSVDKRASLEMNEVHRYSKFRSFVTRSSERSSNGKIESSKRLKQQQKQLLAASLLVCQRPCVWVCVCVCLLEVHFVEGWSSFITATISSPVYGRIWHARNMSWSAMSYDMDLNIWVMNYLYFEVWSHISFHPSFYPPQCPWSKEIWLEILPASTLKSSNRLQSDWEPTWHQQSL